MKLNNIIDEEYNTLLRNILNNGFNNNNDRTGVGCISLFGPQLEIDVSERIPLISSRTIGFKTALKETLWMFCEGSTNIKSLKDSNVNIWNEWAVNDELGPIYGASARAYKGVTGNNEIVIIDQLQKIINNIKTNPFDRRHVLTLWNPATVPDSKLTFEENFKQGKSVLPVCHGVVIQFFVANNTLSLKVYIRSGDVILGTPFNLMNYTILLYMVSNVCKLQPKTLIVTYGDVHIYSNQIESAREILNRPIIYESPSLKINAVYDSINDFKVTDFNLYNYCSHPSIKIPIAV